MKIKEFLKNRKMVITVAAVLAIVCVSIGGTYAFFTSETDVLKNIFSVGSVDTRIDEHIDGLSKIPTVINDGKSECIVRMRVTISPSDTGITLDLPGEGWEEIDGYYYYNGVLEPKEATKALFTKVTLPNDWYENNDPNGKIIESKFIPFDISLYQEGVQATVYDDGGSAKSAYSVSDDGVKVYNKDVAMEIWAAYEAK